MRSPTPVQLLEIGACDMMTLFAIPTPPLLAPQREYLASLANTIAMPEIIHLYHVNEPYGEFSNFAPYPIELNGKLWPTSEHYFQAMKFTGTPYEEEVRLAKSPMIAARMGRDRSRPLRPDWQTVKDDTMRRAVRAKFEQHATLRAKLLSTGESLLVEHTTNDAYWGDGGDGSGRNMLGAILMDLRDALRQVGLQNDESE